MSVHKTYDMTSVRRCTGIQYWRKKSNCLIITLLDQIQAEIMAAFGSKSTDPNEDEQSKEFAQLSSSALRRLNDIAQRPPEMKEMP